MCFHPDFALPKRSQLPSNESEEDDENTPAFTHSCIFQNTGGVRREICPWESAYPIPTGEHRKGHTLEEYPRPVRRVLHKLITGLTKEKLCPDDVARTASSHASCMSPQPGNSKVVGAGSCVLIISCRHGFTNFSTSSSTAPVCPPCSARCNGVYSMQPGSRPFGFPLAGPSFLPS